MIEDNRKMKKEARDFHIKVRPWVHKAYILVKSHDPIEMERAATMTSVKTDADADADNGDHIIFNGSVAETSVAHIALLEAKEGSIRYEIEELFSKPIDGGGKNAIVINVNVVPGGDNLITCVCIKFPKIVQKHLGTPSILFLGPTKLEAPPEQMRARGFNPDATHFTSICQINKPQDDMIAILKKTKVSIVCYQRMTLIDVPV